MKRVAKLIIVDNLDNCLLMYRNNHPIFGEDPDIPGGIVEDGESPLEGVIREASEEIGLTVTKENVKELYSGADYSKHGTFYALFITQVNKRPEIVVSWEHSSYQWLSRDDFIEKAKGANDLYMHMVCDVLKRQ